MLLQISGGTMFFGSDDLFENIDFQINENEKVALVGKNGSGKTTLLKIITGQEAKFIKAAIFRSVILNRMPF